MRAASGRPRRTAVTRTSRHLTIGSVACFAVVTGGWTGLGSVGMTASLPTDGEPLIVRTYDTCGLSAVALSFARRTAGDVLKDVGIAVVWRPCEVLESQAACGAALAPTEIIVRTVHSTFSSEARSVGYSLVDAVQHRGYLSTVYADRVEMLAAQTDVNSRVLLGRTIAHEIGHLLLGTVIHSDRGLMRPFWTKTQLKSNRRVDWLFSGREATLIRQGLAWRAGR
jgi:hypothetical protein